MPGLFNRQTNTNHGTKPRYKKFLFALINTRHAAMCCVFGKVLLEQLKHCARNHLRVLKFPFRTWGTIDYKLHQCAQSEMIEIM